MQKHRVGEIFEMPNRRVAYLIFDSSTVDLLSEARQMPPAAPRKRHVTKTNAERLKALEDLDRGMSREQVASKYGVDPTCITKWAGRRLAIVRGSATAKTNSSAKFPKLEAAMPPQSTVLCHDPANSKDGHAHGRHFGHHRLFRQSGLG